VKIGVKSVLIQYIVECDYSIIYNPYAFFVVQKLFMPFLWFKN